MTTLYEAIRERLAGLTGPDRKVDAMITVAAQVDLPAPMGDAGAWLRMPYKEDRCAPGTYWLVQRSGMSLRTAAPLTGDVDAILALIEQDLPGMGVNIWAWPDFAKATIGTREIDFAEYMAPVGRGQAPTLPLALCLAFTEAKIQIAKADAEGGQNG